MRFRIFAHVLTDGPCPPDLWRVRMMRDIYHCGPLEFARLPLSVVLRDSTAASIEAEAEKVKRG